MKKRGQVVITIVLFLAVILVVFSIGFLFRADIGLQSISSYAILELPKSNSPFLSNLTNDTYLMGEEIYAILIFDEDVNEITNITIGGVETNISKIINRTISFPLNTLIDNGNPEQIRRLTINGWIVNQDGWVDFFSISKNYEIISSKEEILLKISEDNLRVSQKANTISIISVAIAFLSFFFSLYCWKESKRQEKVIKRLELKINRYSSIQEMKTKKTKR